MYQPIVRHNLSRDHLAPNPKYVGWHTEGPEFPTIKGARTARAKLAKRYPDLDTGIQARDGHLVEFHAGTRTLGTWKPPAAVPVKPAPTKKRKLRPRV